MKRFTQSILALLFAGASLQAAPVDDLPQKGWKLPKAELPARNSQSSVTDDAPAMKVRETRPNVKKMSKAPSWFTEERKMLMGYNQESYYGYPNGMYKLDFDGRLEFLYSTEYTDKGYFFNMGWMRNGKLCGLYEYTVFSVLDYVYVETDMYTGEISLSKTISLVDPETEFDNYLPLYISCAYDPTDDTLWGYTISKNGSGYAFFTAPADDVQNTTAVIESEEWGRVCASMCWNDKEKAMYGVNRNNNFVRIERDGSQTIVMPTGVKTKYTRGDLMYDPEEDYYIWNAQLNDGTSGIWCIDPNHGSISTFVDYEGRVSFPLLCMGETQHDPLAISMPIIDKADFGKGLNSGSVSVFMPSTLFSGASLSGNMTWTAYVDGEKYSEGTAEAGSRVVVDFKDLTDGAHKFTFDVVQGDKKSTTATTSLFIGYDNPTKPENVSLTEEQVTWDPVIRGEHGGYMDMDKLIYHVFINGNEIGTTQETYFTHNLNKDVPYSGFVATVVAENSGRMSEESEQSAITNVGAPWKMDVHITPTREQGWTFSSFDANQDKSNWSWANLNKEIPCMREPVSGSAGNDDWLFTPPLDFDDMSTFYEIALDVANRNEWDRDLSLQVYLCSDLNPNSIVTQLFDYKPAGTNTDFNRISQIFNVPSTGTYYIAFHVKHPPYKDGIYIKEIDITKTGTSSPVPSAVSGLKGNGAELGALTANLEFVMPTTYITGEEISSSETIEVEIAATETVIVSGKPGATVTASVPTSQGDNEIKVTPIINGTRGQFKGINVYCGVDIPGPVSSLTGYVSEDNLSLHLFWTAPGNVGENGYYVDPSTVEYVVMRSTTEEGWVTIDTLPNDVNEYTFTVAADNGLKSEWIAILPQNVAGITNSFGWLSDMMGTPYTLPVYEDFAKGRPTHNPLRRMAVTDQEGVTEWSVSDPSAIHSSFASPSGVALTGNTNAAPAIGRLMLPKFCTKGVKDAGIILEAWAGSNMADIRILGEVSGREELIDLGTLPRGNGWTTYEIPFPAEMQDQQWISLFIQGEYPSTSHFVFVTNYSVQGGVSGLNKIVNDASANGVYSLPKQIVIEGHEGENVCIYGVDGKIIKRVSSAPAYMAEDIAPGIYMVVAGSLSAKVVVR